VSGALDQVSDDEAPISCLHFTSPPRPSVLAAAAAAACLPTVMMQFPFRGSHTVTVLLWFRVMVMLRFLSCAQAFLALLLHLSSYCFALNLPRRLAAAADALSGLHVNTDLLLLLVFAGAYRANGSSHVTGSSSNYEVLASEDSGA
jgi:hypothetical protein